VSARGGDAAVAAGHVMTNQTDARDDRLDRSRYRLTFADDFADAALDATRWLDHYLPHWTTPERSAARYTWDRPGLRLLIEADQPAWRLDDGPMRVSNVQTGSFSGAMSSGTGQHRHRTDLLVRTPQPTRRLWTPSAGMVEATVSASSDPTCMLGIWLVGFEDASPQDSGEVCIAELFGNQLTPERSQVRVGIKAHHDPRLRTDVTDVLLDIDATQPHTYAAEWNSRRARFFVDDTLIRTVHQGLSYPLQLMVDLFEFPTVDERDPALYPKSAQVHVIRGYEPSLP
jgi:hypothetical protein